MNRCNLFAVVGKGVSYLPVSTLETVASNKGGLYKDFMFPADLLRMTIQNAFYIYQAQHGPALT